MSSCNCVKLELSPSFNVASLISVAKLTDTVKRKITNKQTRIIFDLILIIIPPKINFQDIICLKLLLKCIH